MLSDLITNVFNESAKDIALVGGMVLVIRIVIWKFKQLVGVAFSEAPTSSSKSASYSSKSRRGQSRASASVAVKPVRNAAYYAGYKQALAAGNKTLTASQRYKQRLQGKYNKGSISYAAGYREGVKQKEWQEYVRMVREEEEQERLEFIRAQIEQKSNDHSTNNIAYRNDPMSQMRLFR